MAKRKQQKDPNGAHSRIYHAMHDSPAFRVLSAYAIKLYLDMRRKLLATNNGNISATLSDLKHRGWKSSKTLSKALYELRALGFIAVTREGGLKQGTRVCTLYRFTDQEVYELPKVSVLPCRATHDYQKHKTVQNAEQALREEITTLREKGRKKQTQKTPCSQRESHQFPWGTDEPNYRFPRETEQTLSDSEKKQGEIP